MLHSSGVRQRSEARDRRSGARYLVLGADTPLGCFAISLRQQKITTAVLLGFLLSGGFAATNLIIAGRQVEASRNELAHTQLAYNDMATRVTRGYDQIRALARRFGNADRTSAQGEWTRPAQLTSALMRGGGLADMVRLSRLYLWALSIYNIRLGNAVANFLDELTLARLEDTSLAEAHGAITTEVKLTQAQLSGEVEAMQRILLMVGSRGQMPSNQVVDLQKSLSIAQHQRDQLAPIRQVASLDIAAIQQWNVQGDAGEQSTIRQIGGLLHGLSVARDENERLARRITEIQTILTMRAGQSDSMDASLFNLTYRMGELKNQLASTQHLQEALINRLAAFTHDAVEDVERRIASSGVNVYELLLRANEQNPIATLLNPTLVGNGGSRLMERLAFLDGEIERFQRLQPLLRTLPLVTPVEDYIVTSPFGMRTDPLTGESSMHEGLDLAHAYLAPVLSPSPGVVVFAGWSGRYGRLVEIDHGLGVHTRYGHLARIDVQVGQEVDYRQRIGLLGNTGHTSGPHVHYEVRVDGRALDPMRFLKAGSALAKAGLLRPEPPAAGVALTERMPPTLAGSEIQPGARSAND